MSRRRFATVAAALLVAGCSQQQLMRGPYALDAGAIAPVEAIRMAADAAPAGVQGRFVMTVRATGRAEANRLFLNSEADYRDQRNLSVAIDRRVARTLLDRAGWASDDRFRGRRIAVDGAARRVRIHFISNGRPTGKYYYQTHVDVRRLEQLSFLD